MDFRLLQAFENVFRGKLYRHRDSSQGDKVASYLYEDLYEVAEQRSPQFRTRVDEQSRVVNIRNASRGIKARRGDGTLGELNLGVTAETANVEIGVEVKIAAKAMIKQLDRVKGDLKKQVAEFQKGGLKPISVALVGVNYAPAYTSVEGDRLWPTNGKDRPHPAQEAPRAEAEIVEEARKVYDEVLVLRFKVSNVDPFPFVWANEATTRAEYGALLIRLCNLYKTRFP
jgi:hypothetical protein